MAIIYKRSPEDIRNELVRLAAQHGYTRLDRFIGSVVDIFSEIYGLAYDELYSLENQMRIDTATGVYLDAWGILLDEPRSQTGTFEDLSFTNVYIHTDNDESVTKYTVGGTGLLIPNGARITDETGRHVLSLVDTVVMDTNKMFIRVIGAPGLIGNLAVGDYEIQGGISDFVISRNSSAQSGHPIIDSPKLIVTVQRPINAEQVALEDDEYRFILESKALSINKSNKHKVDTILRDKRIARFVIKEFTSGSSSVAIYVEPTVSILGKSMEQSLKLLLDELLPYSTVIHVARMIGSLVSMSLEIAFNTEVLPEDYNNIKSEIVSKIISSISNYSSGSSFDFEELVDTARGIIGIEKIRIVTKTVNGLSILINKYTMQDIEYVYAVENSISVTNI